MVHHSEKVVILALQDKVLQRLLLSTFASDSKRKLCYYLLKRIDGSIVRPVSYSLTFTCTLCSESSRRISALPCLQSDEMSADAFSYEWEILINL